MSKNILKGISIKDERYPVVYQEIKGKIIAYDGTEYGEITKEQLRGLNVTSKFVAIRKDERDKKRVNGKLVDKTLQEVHEEFIRDADELKKVTQGRVNMYKTGRDAQTAIYLAYYYLNKKNIVPEPIGIEEFRWLEDASSGPLVFANKYKGKGWKSDINSSYPYIYSNVNFLIPIKAGEFKKITQKEFNSMEHLSVGIYRAKVIAEDSPRTNKVWKTNPKNTYTHYCLNWAKKLGFQIQMIEDDENNLLLYDRDKCKTGSQCFKEYVDLLYPLRSNPIISVRCKALLRCLWGALSQKDEFLLKVKYDEEFEIHDHKEITHMEHNSDTFTIYTIRKDQPYATNWARMKPFLLAKGRIRISEFILPHHEHVHRCHTDSMISDIELPIKYSTKLGDMKLEGIAEECEIVNVNIVTGFD